VKLQTAPMKRGASKLPYSPTDEVCCLSPHMMACLYIFYDI